MVFVNNAVITFLLKQQGVLLSLKQNLICILYIFLILGERSGHFCLWVIIIFYLKGKENLIWLFYFLLFYRLLHNKRKRQQLMGIEQCRPRAGRAAALLLPHCLFLVPMAKALTVWAQMRTLIPALSVSVQPSAEPPESCRDPGARMTTASQLHSYRRATVPVFTPTHLPSSGGLLTMPH